MIEANFVSVFIGIESPNEESLLEAKKSQNVRKGSTVICETTIDLNPIFVKKTTAEW